MRLITRGCFLPLPIHCYLRLYSVYNMKKVRANLSTSDKLAVLKRYDEENLKLLSQREAALKLGVSQSSLSGWLLSRDKIQKSVVESGGSRKRKREGKSLSVDDALLHWFKQNSLFGAPINRGILLQKADDFGKAMNIDFKASDGWLTRWKERHGIIFKKLHGEKLDCNNNAAEDWLATTWSSIKERYQPQDIFNSDETGLYYRATPDKAMVFKSAEAVGCKRLKDRLTVLLTCNMTGTEKTPPLVIGKSRAPRCFKGVKQLPTKYDSNRNAWMTAVIFENFLRSWDAELARKKRKIALLLDNCPAHPHITTLNNIELVFLPPNTTSLIQPLDQGIIKTFKTNFRTNMRKWIINAIEVNPQQASEVVKRLSVLDALHMTVEAWNKVTETTICNCFKKGLKLSGEQDFDKNNNSMTDTELEEWLLVDENLETWQPLTDADIIESISKGDNKFAEEDVEEDPEEERQQPVTKKQALEAVDLLKRYMEEKSGEVDFSLVYKLNDIINKQNCTYQKKLSDYFNKL